MGLPRGMREHENDKPTFTAPRYISRSRRGGTSQSSERFGGQFMRTSRELRNSGNGTVYMASSRPVFCIPPMTILGTWWTYLW